MEKLRAEREASDTTAERMKSDMEELRALLAELRDRGVQRRSSGGSNAAGGGGGMMDGIGRERSGSSLLTTRGPSFAEGDEGTQVLERALDECVSGGGGAEIVSGKETKKADGTIGAVGVVGAVGTAGVVVVEKEVEEVEKEEEVVGMMCLYRRVCALLHLYTWCTHTHTPGVSV